MSTRDNRTALQARFAGLGIAAFASFALLTATPVAALAEEAQVEPPTEEAVVEAAEAEAEAQGDPITEPAQGAAEEAVASDQATQDETVAPVAPAAEPAVADAGEVPAGEPEAAPTDEATSEEATEETDESAEAAPATTDAVQAAPEAAAPANVAAQASAEPAAESLPRKAEGDEEQEQEEPEKTVYQKGVTKVDGVLRYFSKKTTDASAYVKSGEYFDKDGKALYTIEKGVAKKVSTGHYVDKAEGVLYNIKDGKATKISMAGRNYYKCADGAIFFSPSKSSGALATGKKGWKTSSGYGSGKKRYYFHAEKGFIYTQYGYSEAGSYGVLTHKNGYAYTGNIIKGNKVFLILDDGKMLNLTSAQKKTYKYTTTGFRWAKKFGDKINRVTENTKELYFLHEYTGSDSDLYKGAYYVRFKKNKGFWEKAGDGLLYKNYKGKKATYKGPHYNQFYGAILRAVTDRGHNIDIVNAKMPVIHNKQVYLADSNGQLKKQSTKRSDWDSKVQQAYNVVRKLNSSTNYAITVSKTTHTVYLWYSADKRNNWQPMFACRCSTGSETYYDTPEGRVQPLWTPPGQAQTYDHRKYFAGCTYYATGYKKSPDNGWHLHSTIYNLSTGKRVDSRLGKNISNGCIRCNINYARYVYMYLPLRTRTFVY